jgi:tripartite-type tricarboxylate transporter receptor subunit TctC
MQTMRIVSSLLLALWSALAFAQPDYPNHPLRLVVPFPPGGPTDIVARPLAQKLSEQLGQQVIVDNRGGAGGNIGAESVARAAPDGYTLLMGTVGTQAINPALYAKLTYDPTRDLAAVALVAAAPVAVVVHPSVGAKSVRELLALARAKPGQLTFGTAGSGTPGHLTGEMFKSATAASLVHVPYKGSAPAVSDLIGGQIGIMFDPVQSVLSHIRAGRIQALAVSSARRSGALPDVPTLSEAGVPGVETTAWWGLLAPVKTRREVIARLSAEAQRAVQTADLRERLGAVGIEPRGLGSDAFAEFQKAELAKWGKAVRESGATVD